MQARLIGGAAAILLALGGCANPGTTLEWIREPEQAAYTLDAGDQVRVIVIDEPQLSGEFVVDTSGSLSIPTVARIPAKGRTTAELEEAIRNALGNDQIEKPVEWGRDSLVCSKYIEHGLPRLRDGLLLV